jgi:nicotinamidase-related amidase
MTSAPVRNPLSDHLLTPQNTAFLLIDYQPQQLDAVRSMDRALLVKNAVSTVRTIKTYGIPVVHSTVNVANGREQPTLPSPEAHRAGLDRVMQADGQPVSWVSLAGELLRDWARPQAPAIAGIVVTDRLAKEQ